MDKKLIKLAQTYKNKLTSLLKKAMLGKAISDEVNTIWIGDISDHINICNFIIKKSSNYGLIRNKIEDLDTSSREEFSDKIWDYINNQLDKEEECE